MMNLNQGVYSELNNPLLSSGGLFSDNKVANSTYNSTMNNLNINNINNDMNLQNNNIPYVSKINPMTPYSCNVPMNLNMGISMHSVNITGGIPHLANSPQMSVMDNYSTISNNLNENTNNIGLGNKENRHNTKK